MTPPFPPLRLHSAQGANTDTAILAMTGRVDTPDEQWSNAGFNDIVHKPLYKEAFLGKIERWINQQVRFQATAAPTGRAATVGKIPGLLRFF